MTPERALEIMNNGNEAQLHELAHLIAHAEKEATDARADVAKITEAMRIKNDLDEERARKHHAELVNLSMKLADQKTANRRLCAEQVQTLRALLALVEVCEDVRDEEGWTNPNTAFGVKIREAREVLALVDIPF